MTEDPSNTPAARRGRRLFWLLATAVGAAPLAWAAYLTFGPNPPIRVSKETTHITAPLAADGLPDYAAAIRVHIQRDTTPDQNGAIPFLEAMWPEGDDALSPADAKLVCDELGLPCPPSPELRITDFWSGPVRLAALRLYRERVTRPAIVEEPQAQPIEFGNEVLGYDLNEAAFWSAPEEVATQDARVDALLDLAIDRHWTADDLPFAARWIDDHQAGFDRLLAAVERPRWYLPEPGLLRAERGPGSLIGTGYLMPSRAALRYLMIAAGRAQGEGRHDEAARYALAGLRLSRQLASESYLVDHMVAVAVESNALGMLQRLAADPNTPFETLEALLDGLTRIGRAAALVRLDLTCERYFTLATTLEAAGSGVEPIEDSLLDIDWPTDSVSGVADRLAIDWNEVLIALNRRHNDLQQAIASPSRPTRRAALAKIDAEAAALEARLERMWSEPLRFLTATSRGRLVADAYLASTFFSYGVIEQTDVRNQTEYDLTRGLLAAAIHRAEYREWPESLAEVDPDVMVDWPTDPFNDLPYAYRRTEDGVLLYSRGENGIDDGGSCEGDESLWTYGSAFFEGIEIDAMLDQSTDTLTAEERATYDLIDQIPPGADDVSLRAPLPVEPWPWDVGSEPVR